MQVSGVQDSPAYVASTTQQNSQAGFSFASELLGAGASSGSSDDAVQEFMNYAKETPAQRMFSDWLGSQNVTPQQFSAMTPEQQQALINKFEEQLEVKMKSKVVDTPTALTTSSLGPV